MGVAVYTKEVCPVEINGIKCGQKFDTKNGLRCPAHGIQAQKLFIQVTGIKDKKSTRIRIYTDSEGKPLGLHNVVELKQRINRDMDRGVFDSRNYLPKDKKRLTWKNYVKGYLKELKRRTEIPPGEDGWLSLGALRSFKKIQRLYLIPHFGDYELSEVTDLSVIKFIRYLKKWSDPKESSSDSMKHQCISGINHMLAYAVTERDIPPLTFRMPKVTQSKKNITTLSPEQQADIIRFVSTRNAQLILLWAVKTGRRIGEYRAMKIRDVDTNKMEYVVRDAFDEEVDKPFPKVSKTAGAVFPMDEEMVAIYKEATKDRICRPMDYVFLNSQGRHFLHTSLSTVFDKARKKAGYNIALNEFGRHSWATQRIEAGWSFDQVAQFLLNTGVMVEQKYANVTKATRAAILKLHEKPIKKTGGN